MSTTAEVVVIGAGLAGLSAAMDLLAVGRDVLVVEASEAPGGLLRSDASNGYSMAWGPQSFLASSERILELVARCGMTSELVEPASAERRYIFSGGIRHELPRRPSGIAATGLLSLRGKLRLLAEPFQRANQIEGESVTDFFTRRLGAEATEALVCPFVSGVHAGDPDELEAASAFPRLVAWEREHGSLVRGALASRRRVSTTPRRRGLLGLRGGMQSLAQGCARALGTRLQFLRAATDIRREGDTLVVGTSLGDLSARRVILATPVAHAISFLEALAPDAARHAAQVTVAPVAVVHLGGPLGTMPAPLGAFGVLIHRDERADTLGIVFSSSIFPSCAPGGSWLQAAYVGGTTRPRALELDDAQLCERVAEDTRRVMGFDADLGVRHVIRHPAGIPQVSLGHARRIAVARRSVQEASGGALALAGNWLDGPGMEAAARAGARAAAEVLAA